MEPEFVRMNRSRGIICSSDSEIFEAFDLSYEYDVYGYFNGFLTGRNTLSDYARELNREEEIYPDNYDKLRFLENHDRLRAHFVIPDDRLLMTWTAFLYFQKGTTLIYAGQEKGARHTPTLFDKDTVDWKEGGTDLTVLMQKLAQIKTAPVFEDSTYMVKALPHNILLATHTANGDDRAKALGLFSLHGQTSLVNVGDVIPDGSYEDAISGRKIEVNMGQAWIGRDPLIVLYEADKRG